MDILIFMDWMIVLLLILSILAGCITYGLTAKEKTFVFFPYEMFKLIELYRNEKKIKYIVVFIIDIMVLLAILLYCLN